MIDSIKALANKISEAYLNKGENLNDSAFKVSTEHKLNEELVKRLCEFANQNTYLAIFHSDRAKRGNITFDVANAENVLKRIKEIHMADNDYLKSPEDFRLSDEYGQDEEHEEPSWSAMSDVPIKERFTDLNKQLRISDRLAVLLSAIKTMKNQEERGAEDSALKLSSYCKGLVHNGESFGDMAKLALRYTKEKEYNIEKTAKLLSIIGDHLTERGYNVNGELTKTSSLKINHNSETFKPIEDYHQSLLKLAGLREMEETITKLVKVK